MKQRTPPLLFAVVCSIVVMVLFGCTRSASTPEPESTVDATAQALQYLLQTARAEAGFTSTPTITPSPTDTPESTTTRTPRPTSSPTPTQEPCPVFEDVCVGESPLEERDRLKLEQAYRADRLEPCKKEGDRIWACPNDPVFSNTAARTMLALPAYREYQILPGDILQWEYYDVTDPLLERQFQLLDGLGFRGSEDNEDLQILLRCVSGSALYWCPEGAPNERPLRREVAVVWAHVGVFGPEWRPEEDFAGFYPCDVFSYDPFALWVEAPIHLGVKQRGLEPPCYNPDDEITRNDFHVLVELLLEKAGEVVPVIQATPIPESVCVANPQELDEIWDDLKLSERIWGAYRWAYREQIPQQSRMDPFCPEAPLYPDQAALSTLAHPTYRNLPTLRRGADRFTDVSSDIEPKIDLFYDLGFWGEKGDEELEDLMIVWCRGSGRNFCPSDARTLFVVSRGKGTVWAELALHFPTTDSDAYWRPPELDEESEEAFYEKYSDMRRYPDFALWVAAFDDDLKVYFDQGPQRFCPTRKNVFGQEVCFWTQGQWLLILYEINLIHEEMGVEPLGMVTSTPEPTHTPTLTPTATP